MAYQPNIPIGGHKLLGNAGASTADPSPIPLGNNLGFSGSTLSKVPSPPRATLGYATLEEADANGSLISQDSNNTVVYLPGGFPRGFKVRSYQGGDGQISYIGTNGASVINGNLLSAGKYDSGYCVEIENLGSDVWVVLGSTTDQILKWSVYGQTNLVQGDAVTYVIVWPTIVNNYPAGVTLHIVGANLATAGYDKTLAQALNEAVALDPLTSFNGTDTITIKPGAKEPFTFNFFAVPGYAATGDVTVSITISSPSQGTIASGADVVETVVKNTSKPLTPDLLFPTTTLTTSGSTSSGQKNIVVTSVDGLKVYGGMTGSGSIPALSYITAIDTDTNTITVNANLTGTISDAASLTYTPPGFWFNFSDADNITKDGSNNVAQAVDLIHGYHLDQATGANKPVWNATALNGLGGLVFNGSKWMTSTSAPLANIFDAAAAKYTLFIVSKLTSASVNGGYMGCEAISLRTSRDGDIAMTGDWAPTEDVTQAAALNIPYVWSYHMDSYAEMIRMNGQNLYIPATLTADMPTTTRVMTVDDTSGLRKDMLLVGPNKGPRFARIESIDSDTQLTLYTNGGFPPRDTAAGTPFRFVSRYMGGGGTRAARVSTQFVLGSNPTSPANYLAGIGVTEAGTLASKAITAEIYEVIAIPRLLKIQEWRGICLYLATKWGVSVTQQSLGATAAGAMKIPMSSVTGISKGQVITATTGVSTGTTVLAVNATTKVIKVDSPVVAPGISSGQDLVFSGPSFKKPQLLDITQFTPKFREDFTTTLQLWDGTKGWFPYYGNPANPGTYNAAYGAAGHGSSNSGPGEREWYLDTLNWPAWKKYSPFSNTNPADAASGQLVITASPAPAEIANLIGYFPPDTNYDYTSGYLRQDTGKVNIQQYAYYEGRMKLPPQRGMWPALWLTASDGIWPPEVDIMEAHGELPGIAGGAVHSNLNLANVPTYDDIGTGPATGVLTDFTDQYSLFGVETRADFVNFYINRELVFSTPTPQDHHHPFWMQMNLAVTGPSITGLADHVTPGKLEIDYVGYYKRNLQAPTLTGATQAETTALLAAMTVQPDSTRIALINTTIEKLKLYRTSFGLSLWNALDFLFVPAAHNAQAARINWKNPAQIATPVGTPTFTTDKGYAGVFGTSYLDTGINLSSSGYQMNGNLNHIGGSARNLTNNTATEEIVGTAVGGQLTTSTYKLCPISTGTMWNRNMNGATSSGVAIPVTTLGHFVGSRNYYHIVGHVDGAISGTISLSYNYNGLIPVSPLDNANLVFANGAAQISSAHGGAYLTPDDTSYLYTILYGYLHNLSGGGAL